MRETKQELSELIYLNKEIKHIKMGLAELECAAASQSTKITGMPKASGFSDRVAKYATEITALKDLLELNLRKCFRELNRLNRYIEY